jgi:hypothetical protein
MLWWAQPPYTTDVFEWLANLTMLAPMFGSDFMDGAYWSIVIEIIFYGWVAIGLFTRVLPRHTDTAVALWMLLVMVNNTMLGSRPVELLFLTEYGSYFALGVMTWRITSQGASALRLLVAGLALMMTFHAAEVQRLDVIFRLGEASSAQSWLWQMQASLLRFCWQQSWGAMSERGPGSWCLAASAIRFT